MFSELSLIEDYQRKIIMYYNLLTIKYLFN